MSHKCEPTEIPALTEIDIPALRERYRYERERRLRSDAQAQYLQPKGVFSEISDADPYLPVMPRESLAEDIDVAILGGGFSGVLAGYHLAEAGVKTFRTIEHGGDFGGCWYWNRYPGVECDNVSYVYLPLLEEMGYMPSKKFTPGFEIRKYIQSIATKSGLYENALFHTRVTSMRWEETIGRWRLTTNRGDDIRARFVIMATGPLNKPKLPGIPGLGDFKGKIFHSSRWDYDYTGGSQENPTLNKLHDQRIAVIGTGASSVQIVPYLGRFAQHLYVIQRTPSSVDERDNQHTDPAWSASLKPGWHQEYLRNFQRGLWTGFERGEPDVICDIWTEINRNIHHELEKLGWPEMTLAQMLEFRDQHGHRTMERLRRRVGSLVSDQHTAELLKPYYHFMCKRPCSNDYYYSTFNSPNVELIDVSHSRGVERLTKNGFMHEGKEYEVDCIITASGYEQTSELKKRWDIDVIEGRDGVSIYDYWAKGPKTLHGMSSSGFPNQFFIGFIQGAVHGSTTETFSRQGQHIAYIIKETLERGVKAVEPSLQAQEEWVNLLRPMQVDAENYQRECTPGYYNNEGGDEFRYFLGEVYTPGPYDFWGMLEQWRSDGKLKGLTVSF